MWDGTAVWDKVIVFGNIMKRLFYYLDLWSKKNQQLIRKKYNVRHLGRTKQESYFNEI